MKVIVTIPIYKNQHTPCEMMSIRQTCHILRNHAIVFVCPETLDVTPLAEEFQNCVFERFSDHYFQGLEGYNRLMLSTEFYERFRENEYLLIAQPDVFIFRDELEEWCNKGYDYVAAPWLRRNVYNRPIVKQYMDWQMRRANSKGLRVRQNLFGKIGNGGLSLRRISSFINVISSKQNIIRDYLENPRPFYAEDTFFGLECPEFNYPTVSEALLFSFDKDPDYCYSLTGGKLPFGCHAWYKGKTRHFWFAILGIESFSSASTRYPIR